MSDQVTEIKTAAELNTQNPPPFTPSTEGLPPPMDDNAVRAIFSDAASKGIDDLNAVVQGTAPQGQPTQAPPAVVQAPAPIDVPAKFLKPDGTPDEEKLKASSAQLNAAVEQRQKTIEEILSEYKENERKFHQQGQQLKQVQNQAPPVVPPGIPTQPLQDPASEAMRLQILQDFQRDPVGTMVEISRVIAQRESTQAVAQISAEQAKDSSLRTNLARLAEEDPRILQPDNYAVVSKILYEEDPQMLRLKNPYKAAWSEAKERLRLGEVARPQAQPSNPSPILGRGVPAPVSGLPNPNNTQSLFQQVNQEDFKDPNKVASTEAALRELTARLWQ